MISVLYGTAVYIIEIRRIVVCHGITEIEHTVGKRQGGIFSDIEATGHRGDVFCLKRFARLGRGAVLCES